MFLLVDHLELVRLFFPPSLPLNLKLILLPSQLPLISLLGVSILIPQPSFFPLLCSLILLPQLIQSFLSPIVLCMFVHIGCKHFLLSFLLFYFRPSEKHIKCIFYFPYIIFSIIGLLFVLTKLFIVDLCKLKSLIVDVSDHLFFLLGPLLRHDEIHVKSLVLFIFDEIEFIVLLGVGVLEIAFPHQEVVIDLKTR